MSADPAAAPPAEPQLGDLLGNAATSVGLRLLAVLLGFVFTVLLARVLGAEEAGVYLLAFNIVSVLAISARLGLDDVVVRSVAADRADGNWAAVLGVVQTGTRVTLATSAGLSLVVLLTADWWASRALRMPELSTPLRILTLAIVPLALADLWGYALRGLARIRASQWVLFVNPRLLNLVGLMVIGGAWGSAGLAWVVCVSAAIGVGVAARLVWQSARRMAVRPLPIDARRLLAPGVTLFATLLCVMMTERTGLLVLGAIGGSADAGIFGTCLRTAGLLSLALHATEVAVAPRFAALSRGGHLVELRQLARMATRLIAWATVPPVIAVVIFRESIMRIFGDDFAAGGWALAILVAGQCFAAIAGPASSILVMSGRERLRLAITGGTTLLCVALNLVLIPAAGLTGAALATTLAWGAHGALTTIAVFRLQGFWILSNPFRFREST